MGQDFTVLELRRESSLLREIRERTARKKKRKEKNTAMSKWQNVSILVSVY